MVCAGVLLGEGVDIKINVCNEGNEGNANNAGNVWNAVSFFLRRVC